MAFTIPFDLEIVPDTPSPPLPPGPGYILKSAWAYPALFEIPSGDLETDTVVIDFFSPKRIDGNFMYGVMRDVVVPAYDQMVQDVMTYMLWEKLEMEVSVPDQICLAGYCWEPPFAGSIVASLYRYRLWIMTKTQEGYAQVAIQDNTMQSAPFIPVAAVLFIVMGILVAIPLIAMIIAVFTGKIRWSELQDMTETIIKAPGENVAQPFAAMFWPFAALGFTMAAAGIVLPRVAAKAEASVPVGGGRVGGEIGVGGAPAPARAPRRR